MYVIAQEHLSIFQNAPIDRLSFCINTRLTTFFSLSKSVSWRLRESEASRMDVRSAVLLLGTAEPGAKYP